MKFFARVVFICNLCFLASAVMRYIETGQKAIGKSDQLISLPWLQNILVILGYSAFFVSILFALVFLLLWLFKKSHLISRWLVIANLAFLIIQFIYFFTNLIP